MYNTCPTCKYDLTGLDRETPCPECGGDITHRAIHAALSRRCRRYWMYFWLAPLMTLPGCLAYLIGQPILCMIICTSCALRALRLDDAIHEREPTIGLLFLSLLVGTAWTVAGMALLVTCTVAIVTVTSHVH